MCLNFMSWKFHQYNILILLLFTEVARPFFLTKLSRHIERLCL